MDGIDQLFSLNDEYRQAMLGAQDYKRNLVALISSFTEDELQRFAQVISLGEDAIKQGGH